MRAIRIPAPAAIALPLAALLLLPFVTSGRTAVPAPVWVGLLAAGAVVLGLARGGAPRAAVDLPLAAGFGLAAAVAHLAPGMVLGHDAYDHAWGAWAYRQAWHAGDLLPIWLHHLGVGQPMPLFYGPLPFWAMAPLVLAGLGTAGSMSGGAVLTSIVAAVSAWLATAAWTRDRRAALVAAIALAYAPYRLLDLNYRAAIGESWAIALFPVALLAFERLLVVSSRRRFAAAAAATAVVTLAHPLSLPLLAGAVVVVALAHPGVGEAGRRASGPLRAVARGALAGLAGLAAAGFFVVPLLAELRYLPLSYSFAGWGRRAYAAHGLHPLDLVDRRLWDRMLYSLHGHRAAEPLEQPFYFGLVLLLALGALLLLGRRAVGPGGPRAPRFALALAGALLLASAIDPVARLESLLPGVSVLQFPWRSLGPASALAALAAGLLAAAAGWTASGRLVRWLPTALALALLVDGLPYTGAVARLRPWTDLVVASKLVAGEQSGREVPGPWPMRVHGPAYPPARCCPDVGQAGLVYREYMAHGTRDLTTQLLRSGVGLALRLGKEPVAVPVDSWPYASRERGGKRRRRQVLPFERGGGEIVVELPDGAGGRVVVAEQWFPGWRVEIDGARSAARANRDGLLRVDVPAGVRRVRFVFDRWRWDRALGWAVSAAAIAALAVAAARRPAARS